MPRTIVITGAAAGIGRQAARQFAAYGFTVCATDLDAAGLDSLKGELGARHAYAVLDVTDKDAVARVFADFAGAHGGSFDVLLNNAGVTFLENFEELPLERHELVVDVNVNGVVNCTYLAFPYLSRAENAKVVNMCSLSAEYGVPSFATYSATKAFVRGFTEAINIEWDRHGIHVCDVLPNFVATAMTKDVGGEVIGAIGVNLGPEDVARTIVKAAADRTRVHWVVDTVKPRILRAVMNTVPTRVHRAVLKRVAGY